MELIVGEREESFFSLKKGDKGVQKDKEREKMYLSFPPRI